MMTDTDIAQLAAVLKAQRQYYEQRASSLWHDYEAVVRGGWDVDWILDTSLPGAEEALGAVESVIHAMAEMLRATTPNFDTVMFLEACGQT